MAAELTNPDLQPKVSRVGLADMSLQGNERAKAEIRQWEIINHQASHRRKSGVLEALSLFHNQNLITVELMANALGEPVKDGPMSPESPLRGLRTNDKIRHHPTILAVKKMNQLLEASHAPDDLIKQGDEVLAILTEAYSAAGKTYPYDGNDARAMWVKELGLEETRDATGKIKVKITPGELLYEGAKKNGLIPNTNPVLRESQALSESSLREQETAWNKLVGERGKFNETSGKLSKYLEVNYEKLEQISVKPLIAETITWCKATTDLEGKKKKAVEDYLLAVDAYGKTLPLLEGQTLRHAAQLTMTQMVSAVLLDCIEKHTSWALKKEGGVIAANLAKAASKRGLRILSNMAQISTAMEVVGLIGDFVAPLMGKDSAEDLAIDTISDVVKDLAESTFKKTVDVAWERSSLNGRVEKSLINADAINLSSQEVVNQQMIPKIIAGMSPAGRKCAETIGKLCLFCNSQEGFRSFSTTQASFSLFDKDGGPTDAWNITDQSVTGKEDDSEVVAREVATKYAGWLHAQDPGNAEGYAHSIRDLSGFTANPETKAEKELVEKSPRLNEIISTVESVQLALKDRETALSTAGVDRLRWVAKMHGVKQQVNPFETNLMLRNAAVQSLYEAAKKDSGDVGLPGEERQLHNLAYLMGLRPDYIPQVVQAPALEDLHAMVQSRGNLADPPRVIIPTYLQTKENLLTPINGKTLLELAIEREKEMNNDGCHRVNFAMLVGSHVYHQQFLQEEFTPSDRTEKESVGHYLARNGHATEVSYGRVDASLLEDPKYGKPISFYLLDQDGEFLALRAHSVILDASAKDAQGVTLVAYAARANRLKDIENVIVTADDLSVQDQYGSCAWHYIARNQNWRQALSNGESGDRNEMTDLENVWDVHLKPEHLLIADHNGVTPLKLAQINKSTHLIPKDILKRAEEMRSAIVCVEPVTRALVKRYQGQPLTDLEQSFFPNGELHPLLINRLKGNDPEAQEFIKTSEMIEEFQREAQSKAPTLEAALVI